MVGGAGQAAVQQARPPLSAPAPPAVVGVGAHALLDLQRQRKEAALRLKLLLDKLRGHAVVAHCARVGWAGGRGRRRTARERPTRAPLVPYKNP